MGGILLDQSGDTRVERRQHAFLVDRQTEEISVGGLLMPGETARKRCDSAG